MARVVKPRGFGAIEIIGVLVAAAALAGVIFAGIHGVTNYLEGERTTAKAGGKAECDAEYKARDNAALQAALVRTKALEDQARETERGHVAALAKVEKQRLEAIANGETAEKRVLARIESGDLVVRPGAFKGGGCPAIGGGSQVGPAIPPAAWGDGARDCGLSPDAERRVLAIGKDANRVRDKLTACQAVIAEDRRICGQ